MKIGQSFTWFYKGTPHTSVVEATCARCGAAAIIALPLSIRMQQTDGTTHVCCPAIGGCNLGYEKVPAPRRLA